MYLNKRLGYAPNKTVETREALLLKKALTLTYSNSGSLKEKCFGNKTKNLENQIDCFLHFQFCFESVNLSNECFLMK